MKPDGIPTDGMGKADSRSMVWLILALTLIGLAAFSSAVMVMRSGGIPRMLFVLAVLCLLYLGYETIQAIRRRV